MTDEILVFVSSPESLAEILAKSLVEEKLAACVSILPRAKSIYFWENQLCQEYESLLLIKSNRFNFVALEKHIKAIHTYTVPEIIALPIVEGNAQYLQWLNSSLQPNQI